MRLANTTFVNLRSALGQPSSPCRRLQAVGPQAGEAVGPAAPAGAQLGPTLNDLSDIITRPGPNNDLIELTSSASPLAAATVRNVTADGRSGRRIPRSTTALTSRRGVGDGGGVCGRSHRLVRGYTHPGTIDARRRQPNRAGWSASARSRTAR